MATYSELLQDSRWQTRRVTILNRDGWACANPDCPGTSRQLHVHHLWYANGRAPWQYPDDALVTLCADCHAEQHTEPVCSPLVDAAGRLLLWLTGVVLAVLQPIVNLLLVLGMIAILLVAIVYWLRDDVPWFSGWVFIGMAGGLLLFIRAFGTVMDFMWRWIDERKRRRLGI